MATLHDFCQPWICDAISPVYPSFLGRSFLAWSHVQLAFLGGLYVWLKSFSFHGR